ncbi:MAG: hypothetical protein R2828_23140 [Saprospiraceae bacterium]
MTKFSKLFLLLITASYLASCATNSAEKTLLKALQKQKDSQVISYDYINETDNIFNETHYADTASIVYFKTDSSYHGFGIHALTGKEEHLFDGFHYEKFKHAEKIRVSFEEEEIKDDPNYFSNLSFFAVNPMQVPAFSDFDSVFETMINHKRSYIYKKETQRKSMSDSSQIIRYQRLYYIAAEAGNIHQIQDIIISSEDTLQIANHYFSNYHYENTSFNLKTLERLKLLDYTNIKSEDEFEAFEWTPIKVGEKVAAKTFIDINGQETAIYGTPGKLSLILFSFIGCAPCEIALKDWQKEGYHFNPDINIYYSSFQNKGSVLKKYLAKKNFPFTAFGQESHMIESFSLYFAPSFALIDAEGTVLKVIEGYDEEVKKTLLKLLLPR